MKRKPDCIKNCAHHYIADHVKTFGGSIPVAGCRMGSFCVVGQNACAKYSPSNAAGEVRRNAVTSTGLLGVSE
jgi:hypothetical protein